MERSAERGALALGRCLFTRSVSTPDYLYYGIHLVGLLFVRCVDVDGVHVGPLNALLQDISIPV